MKYWFFIITFLLSCTSKEPGAPNAHLKVSGENGVAPFKVVFNAQNSSDDDGSIVSYSWNFGDGTAVTTTEKTVEHTYTNSGNFVAMLTVEDNDGKLGSILQTINVIEAGEGIEIGEATYGGTGCPEETASITLSPDKKAISVLFDEFYVTTDEMNLKDRISCSLAIPIKVPSGFGLNVYKVDYRGFASVPEGGSGKFSVDYFFSGTQGEKFVEKFSGGFDDSFSITDDQEIELDVQGECGADVIFRVDTALELDNRGSTEEGMMQVDSIDSTSGIKYYFTVDTCGAQ